MWVFQNDSFLSIVRHRAKPDHLLVRSRVKGDIERAFAGIEYTPEVYEIDSADYRYRADVPAQEVAKAIAASIQSIDYPNFKNSIPTVDTARRSAYGEVWGVLANLYGSFGRKQ